MAQKKIALLIYPGFSNYEIAFVGPMAACIGRQIELIAKTPDPVPCEDGFRFVPDQTLAEVDLEAYDCLVLPGIGGDLAAILNDSAYISFLEQFKSRTDYVIASICISPTLLGKAGLLEGRRFCAAILQESKADYPLDYDNIIYAPIVVDGHIITALDVAYREFAIEIARQLGYQCREGWFGQLDNPREPAERFVFRLDSWENPFTHC